MKDNIIDLINLLNTGKIYDRIRQNILETGGNRKRKKGCDSVVLISYIYQNLKEKNHV